MWATCQRSYRWPSGYRWSLAPDPPIVVPVNLGTHAEVISPVSEYIIGTDILVNQQIPKLVLWPID